MRDNSVVILVGETGSGKTTQIAQVRIRVRVRVRLGLKVRDRVRLGLRVRVKLKRDDADRAGLGGRSTYVRARYACPPNPSPNPNPKPTPNPNPKPDPNPTIAVPDGRRIHHQRHRGLHPAAPRGGHVRGQARLGGGGHSSVAIVSISIAIVCRAIVRRAMSVAKRVSEEVAIAVWP